MNKEIQDFARTNLKQNSSLLTEKQIKLFKQFYSYKDLNKIINDIIDDMPDDKLDLAMEQVRRTVEKNKISVAEHEQSLMDRKK